MTWQRKGTVGDIYVYPPIVVLNERQILGASVHATSGLHMHANILPRDSFWVYFISFCIIASLVFLQVFLLTKQELPSLVVPLILF